MAARLSVYWPLKRKQIYHCVSGDSCKWFIIPSLVGLSVKICCQVFVDKSQSSLFGAAIVVTSGVKLSEADAIKSQSTSLWKLLTIVNRSCYPKE